LKLRVIKGGVIKSRKGVNIPKFKIKNRIISEKDRLDIEFGIENKADMIAQSFVTDSNDIKQVVRLVKEPLPECQIIAKIENAEGIKNVEKIIESCDGIMVARGDMGVSLPMYKIPIIQKYIIRQCNRKKKSVIVATQMLESMIDNPRPTRAEVSDIANAILDGTDYVMLSAESAVGKYPVECVDLMQQIIVFTEQYEARGI
jgi:pyruvate kinase